MDSTIKRILGEAEDEGEEPKKKKVKKPGSDAASIPGATGADKGDIAENDAEIDELANLWTTGNKGEVVHRFMEMNNERSVKLVFAIGRDGALDLAKMVDQAMEQNPSSTETSTEPERIEPPAAEQSVPNQGDYVRQVLGQPVEA